MIKILLSEPDGSLTVMTVENDLPAFQKLVGGYIEGVALSGGAMGYVDEEGLLKGLPLNPVASVMAQTQIVGPMVIFGLPLANGIETDVPQEFIDSLAALGFVIMEEDT